MRKRKTLIYIIVFSSIVLIIATGILVKELMNDNTSSDNISKEVNSSQKEKVANKVIELLKKENIYIEKYQNKYRKIDYVNTNNFGNNINKLLELNYEPKEINYLYKNKANIIDELVKTPKIDLDYIKVSNFRVENIKRYLDYKNKENFDLEKTITYVNIGLDNEFYTNIDIIKEPHNINVLVNKYHKLPEDFEPKELVNLSGSMLINKIVKEPITNLVNDAKKAGYNLCYYSGYRTYKRQVVLYNGYVARDGQKKADTYSARPGHTEHNTGLAVDLCTSPGVTVREKDGVYKWLTDNAHKYGFILRFPKGKEHITGYDFEPWHYRYLGVDLATKVKKSNLTYEEYYDLNIK